MSRRLHLRILLYISEENALAQNLQWQPIGPWGGTVDDIAIAPSETNVLYARQVLSVLKRNDFGMNWTARMLRENPWLQESISMRCQVGT